jgi:hypothetical protein
VIEVPELALTVIQPMGTAIVKGWKPIENRKWRPWRRVIGKLIAIHAGVKWDVDYALFIDRLVPSANARWTESPQSAIIGVARVVTSVDRLTLLQTQHDRDWFTGPHGWVVMDAREIDPIPCKGSQGLWKIPDSVRATLAERLKEVANG